MKTFLIGLAFAISTMISGCGIFDSKDKDEEISRLRTALADQQGRRAAELDYSERQASYYLGCKTFFNRCSNETTALGERLLLSGFTGRTSGWYWLGLLGEMICLLFSLIASKGIYKFWHLSLIKPKEEEVESAQKLVDEVDDYVKCGNQWRAEHAVNMNREKSRLAVITKEIAERNMERTWLEELIQRSQEELNATEVQIETLKMQRLPIQKSEDF